VSFADKLRNFFNFTANLPETFFDDLGDLLVEGDFGAAPAMKLVNRLEQISRKEKITGPEQLRARFVRLLEEELLPGDGDRFIAAAPASQTGPASQAALPAETPPVQVILLLGVNGVGKTTTAAKLAARFRRRGRRPILAAADTFRAAAVDQLKIHGERLGIRVVAHRQGGDPAAVVYDAAEAALAGGGDLIIADTAGRMHTKSALVEELKKIDRVLETKLGAAGTAGVPGNSSAPDRPERCIKWLVLDATTGRNALAQAEIFHEAVALDGAILTKYESGARGGIVFSLVPELRIPTVFLCDGEGYDHIRPFDPPAFVRDFAGFHE
jgi:fused signal recognition particle receptor